MFFYYQLEGGQDIWRHDLLASRDSIIQQKAPRYVTALALSRPIDSETPAEEIEKTKYLGPFYVDFDSPELALSIKQFNLFLDKLEEAGVDLETLHLYATGGRGFHIEVPMETFMVKLPKDGLPNLPYVYKEVAMSMYVDTLDLRVYSAKRGRMWRTPNVQRENGAYKVPLSVREARMITEETYSEYCAKPRQYVSEAAYSELTEDPRYVRQPATPKIANGLVLAFAEAMLKVKDGLSKRKKNAKQVEALAKFKGEFPPTLKALLANQQLKDNAGWNQIAMQIAIVGNALGKGHDQVVTEAAELLENHRGNGGRYSTRQARETELRAQLAYTHDNPCYSYSVGAIKVLLEPSAVTADLEGVTDEVAIADITAARAEAAAAGEDAKENELERGIVIGVGGIRQKVGSDWMTWTNVGFDKVSMLARADTGKPLVFEADMYFFGEPRGRVPLPLEVFLSRQKFHAFLTSETGGSFQGTDATVQAIQEAMIVKARLHAKENAMEWVIRREGLNYIEFPANVQVPESARAPFPVWSSGTGCAVPPKIAEAGVSFRFFGDPNPAGLHKTDVMQAPALADSEKLRRTLHALFNMNRPRSIGPMLGWLAACHARMFYHRYKGSFPLLCVAGESGAGKTTTLRALGKLHFYKREMPKIQCTSSTPYAIEEQIIASASVPVYIDEYKPRSMSDEKTERIRAIFRGSYDNGTIIKGGGAQINLGSGREITERTLSGPIVFLSEAIETETAIVERSVQCVFDKGGQHGRDKHMLAIQRDGEVFASVGREIARLLLAVEYQDFCDSFDKDYTLVYGRMFAGSNSRIVYNYAVALHGLTMLQEVLAGAGVDAKEELAILREAVLEGPIALGGDGVEVTDAEGKTRFESKSEAAKVLSAMALMSVVVNPNDSTALRHGFDYAFGEVGGEATLELCLPRVWSKYEEWCGRKRRAPLYDSEESFRFAMKNFVGYMDATPVVLSKEDGVVRFRLEALRRAQVSSFKRQGG